MAVSFFLYRYCMFVSFSWGCFQDLARIVVWDRFSEHVVLLHAPVRMHHHYIKHIIMHVKKASVAQSCIIMKKMQTIHPFTEFRRCKLNPGSRLTDVPDNR
ncbi:MAG: hypothetical protein D6820_07435 [Lentisphaerae bacterium]|nr:MAG: hypothetical protein D6820_07435 [Lentisphaerota bacterium]